MVEEWFEWSNCGGVVGRKFGDLVVIVDSFLFPAGRVVCGRAPLCLLSPLSALWAQSGTSNSALSGWSSSILSVVVSVGSVGYSRKS